MFAVVVGAGRLGEHIIKHLSLKRYKIAIIEKNTSKCDDLSTRVEAMIFDGDGSDKASYKNLEMNLADMLFAVTDDDDVNIAVCKMANIDWGIPYVVARVKNPKRKEELKNVGADVVICPVEEAFASFENSIERPIISTIFVESNLNHKISFVKIPPNGVVVGKSIDSLRIPLDLRRDLHLPKDSKICTIVRRGKLIFPDNEMIFESEDLVFITGSIQSVDEVANILRRVE